MKVRGGHLTVWVLLIALGIGVPAGAAPFEVVRVVFQPFQSNGALFIADREGYFVAQGLQIRWVPLSSVEMIPVLAQGQVDVGAGSASAAFFNVVAAGQKIRLVADKGHASGPGSVGSVIVRRALADRVKSVSQLAGLRVAVSGPGSLSHYALARALASVGLTLNAATVVFMPAPDALAALQGGSIDAIVLGAPLDAQAVQAGFATILADMADLIPGEPTAFLLYGPSFLEQQRATGMRFLVAYLRGVRKYREGPTARNIEIVADYVKIDPLILRRGGWIGIHDDGFIDVTRLRRYQDWLYEIGLIGVRNPIGIIVDPSFAESARSILGLPPR